MPLPPVPVARAAETPPKVQNRRKDADSGPPCKNNLEPIGQNGKKCHLISVQQHVCPLGAAHPKPYIVKVGKKTFADFRPNPARLAWFISNSGKTR